MSRANLVRDLIYLPEYAALRKEKRVAAMILEHQDLAEKPAGAQRAPMTCHLPLLRLAEADADAACAMRYCARKGIEVCLTRANCAAAMRGPIDSQADQGMRAGSRSFGQHAIATGRVLPIEMAPRGSAHAPDALACRHPCRCQSMARPGGRRTGAGFFMEVQ